VYRRQLWQETGIGLFDASARWRSTIPEAFIEAPLVRYLLNAYRHRCRIFLIQIVVALAPLMPLAKLKFPLGGAMRSRAGPVLAC